MPDFPRAICRRKAMERSGPGSRDSPAFRRHQLPVRLLLVRQPLCVKLLASSSAAVPSAVRRSPFTFALRLLFCVCMCQRVGLHVIGIRAEQAAPPSGTLAAGCDLTRHRTIVSALAGLIFALACVGHVLSWCALLKCRARVCLSAHRSRLSCLTLS